MHVSESDGHFPNKESFDVVLSLGMSRITIFLVCKTIVAFIFISNRWS